MLPGVTLIQCGGHFAGSAVAHWASGASWRGALPILTAVAPYPYDRLYGGFVEIDRGGRTIVERSLERYIAWLRGDVADEPAR